MFGTISIGPYIVIYIGALCGCILLFYKRLLNVQLESKGHIAAPIANLNIGIFVFLCCECRVIDNGRGIRYQIVCC